MMLIKVLISLFSLGRSFSQNKPIFLTGATSKLGQNVVNELTSKDYSVRCLVRDTQKALDIYENNDLVTLVKGDILDVDSLNMAMFDCSMAISVHGTTHPTKLQSTFKITDKSHPYFVNYVATKNVVDACIKNNIPTFVRTTGLLAGYSQWNFFSMLFNAVFSNNIHWHRQSEKYIRESGVTYTIIRPGGIKEQRFNGFEIYDEITSPPANIDVFNLAKVVSLCSISVTNSTFDNKIIACKGVN